MSEVPPRDPEEVPPADEPIDAEFAPPEPSAPEPPPAAAPPPSGPPPAGPTPDPYGLGPTSMGMAANVAAALSYVFTWLTGLIFFLVEKDNKFVRFHAMQSILLGITFFAFYMLFGMLLIPLMFAGGGVVLLLLNVIGIAFFVLWIVCIVQAATGKWFKLPIIGDFAAKQAGL